jgi:hypothetical protein
MLLLQMAAICNCSFTAELLMIALAAVITYRKKVELHSDCKSAITLVKQRMQLTLMTKHAAFNLLQTSVMC